MDVFVASRLDVFETTWHAVDVFGSLNVSHIWRFWGACRLGHFDISEVKFEFFGNLQSQVEQNATSKNNSHAMHDFLRGLEKAC